MTKICTDVSQSKKLIELGLDVNTADMYYPYLGDNQYGETARIGQGMKYSGKEDIHTWSLSALFDLFPNGSILRKSDKGKYFMFGNMFDNPLDAAFEMVVWLKENKKI